MKRQLKGSFPVGLRRAVKINRARMFESLGSTRYSMPALNELDKQMLEYLPEKGVFLEIGANDGYSQSNTYYLERVKGWRGVLIEPLPSLFDICQRLRSRSSCVNVGCVGPNGPATIEVVDMNLMSVTVGLQSPTDETERLRRGTGRRGSKRTITVPARTISGVLDDVHEPTIDFMSIDVEGSESTVLAGLDLDRHTPSHLLVETKNPDTLSAQLQGYMLPVRQLSFHDYLFVAASRSVEKASPEGLPLPNPPFGSGL